MVRHIDMPVYQGGGNRAISSSRVTRYYYVSYQGPPTDVLPGLQYWPETWGCAVNNWQRGPRKPEFADSSAPGEVYPQKWCTTLWVNEQNMMYDRGRIKREALKTQSAAALCLAHCRIECSAFLCCWFVVRPIIFVFAGQLWCQKSAGMLSFMLRNNTGR